MDETAVSVRGGLHYLCRAVDKHGKSVASLLRTDKGMEVAQAFFRKAVAIQRRRPAKVNLDGNAASHGALRLLGEADSKWKSVVVRSCRYPNNLVEQDHRAIKRRCASMLGLKSFETAAITFAGIELAHRIRKQQFHLGRGATPANWSLKQFWERIVSRHVVYESGHDPRSRPDCGWYRSVCLKTCSRSWNVRAGAGSAHLWCGRKRQ